MYILLIVMSPFVFIPKSFNRVQFSSKESCEQALVEAKKQWTTIDDQSKCVDLGKESKIKAAEDELKKLKGNE